MTTLSGVVVGGEQGKGTPACLEFKLTNPGRDVSPGEAPIASPENGERANFQLAVPSRNAR